MVGIQTTYMNMMLHSFKLNCSSEHSPARIALNFTMHGENNLVVQKLSLYIFRTELIPSFLADPDESSLCNSSREGSGFYLWLLRKQMVHLTRYQIKDCSSGLCFLCLMLFTL